MPTKLGKNMKQVREQLGMSQPQIVEVLSYKDTPLRASQISQYEQGQREPTMMLVLEYARLAKVPMECLIDKMKWPKHDLFLVNLENKCLKINSHFAVHVFLTGDRVYVVRK